MLYCIGMIRKHATTTAKKCKKSNFDTKEQEILPFEWEREKRRVKGNEKEGRKERIKEREKYESDELRSNTLCSNRLTKPIDNRSINIF